MESYFWKNIIKFNSPTVLLLFAIFDSGLGFNHTIRVNCTDSGRGCKHNIRVNCTDDHCNTTISLFNTHDIQQFIVGGVKAKPDEFPSQVALCMVKSTHTELRCAGTIVSRHHVVTAGHCVYSLDKNPEMFKILAGTTNVENFDHSKDVFDVSEIFLHEDYEDKLPPVCDIAICKVSRSFAEHGSLAPSPLPTRRPQVSQMCTATGWGLLTAEKKVISPDLMKVDMPIYDSYECASRYYPSVRVDTVECVCAGYNKGKSICNGDSGGPLFCGTSRTLYGVASWGHSKCGEGNYPSVFVNVYHFSDWIRSCMKQ